MNMKIIHDNKKIEYLYHYTKKENVNSILHSKVIHSQDRFLFFTDSYEKSVELFESEMMSHHYYYDLDCILRQRIPANKEDYCIIKIPYKNDGKFVKFIFDHEDDNSIYSKSTIHEGTLYFKKAKVLEIINYEKEDLYKNPFINKFKLSIASIGLSFLLAFPRSVYADSWYDHIDIDSWSHENIIQLDFTTPEQFAGFAYLSNTGGLHYNSNPHSAQYAVRLPQEMDLTAHDWVPIHNTKSCICGTHRFILKAGEKFGEMNMCRTPGSPYIKVDYLCNVTLSEADHGTASISTNSGITGDKVILTVTPDSNYRLDGIKINGEKQNLYNFTNEGTNKYGYKLRDSNITFEPVFIGQDYNFTYECDAGTRIDGNFIYHYGSEYSIPIHVHPAYRITSVKVNGVETEVVDGFIHGIATGNTTISVESEKVGYTVIQDESKSIVIDFSKAKNSLELSYLQFAALNVLNYNDILLYSFDMDSKTGFEIFNGYESIENKKLIDVDESYSYYQTDSISSNIDPYYIDAYSFQYMYSSEVATSEDNIYYLLTEEDKEYRTPTNNAIFEKYDSIIIKFGDYNVEESEKKDLVINFSSLDGFVSSPQIYIPYLIDKGVLQEEYDADEDTITLKNKDGKALAIMDPCYFMIEAIEGTTSEDNITYPIDDEFKAAFPNLANSYDNVKIIFAEETKSSNILVNPKTGGSIILSMITLVIILSTTYCIRRKKYDE